MPSPGPGVEWALDKFMLHGRKAGRIEGRRAGGREGEREGDQPGIIFSILQVLNTHSSPPTPSPTLPPTIQALSVVFPSVVWSSPDTIPVVPYSAVPHPPPAQLTHQRPSCTAAREKAKHPAWWFQATRIPEITSFRRSFPIGLLVHPGSLGADQPHMQPDTSLEPRPPETSGSMSRCFC